MTPAERAAAWQALEQRHRTALAAGRASRAARRIGQQADRRAARDLAAALRAAGLSTTPATAPSHPHTATDGPSAAPNGGPAWYRGSSVSAAAQGPSDGGGCGHLIKASDARLRLRDGIQTVTDLPSVRGCERAPLGDAVGVHIRPALDRRTSFSGLVKCGSVWACPPCSAKIRAERAAELERFAAAWLRSGRGIYMATLTVPHWKHVRLATQFDGVANAWRGVGQGSWWVGRAVIRDGAPVAWANRHDYPDLPLDIEPHDVDGHLVVWKRGWKARHGIAGTTRVAEVTHGANGWHTHLHVLLWTEQEATRAKADELQAELYLRWARRAKAAGLPTPDPVHGVRVDPAILAADGSLPLALVKYVAKVQDKDVITNHVTSRNLAAEIARGDTKLARGAKGRTPFQLAEMAVAGDETALQLWSEYERATKGRRCLTWSEGLRELLADLAGEELDTREEEELVNPESDELDERIPDLAIRGQAFRTAVADRRGGRADLVLAGDVGGVAAVVARLVQWGLTPGEDFWKPEVPLGQDPAVKADQLKRAQAKKAERQARHERLQQEHAATPERWAAAAKKRAKTIAARAGQAAAAQAELIDHQALAEAEDRTRTAAADRFLAARRAALGTDPAAADAIRRRLEAHGLVAAESIAS